MLAPTCFLALHYDSKSDTIRTIAHPQAGGKRISVGEQALKECAEKPGLLCYRKKRNVFALPHFVHLKGRAYLMANKEQNQKKEQKAGPKSNKQKKEAAREKKAAKNSKTSV